MVPTYFGRLPHGPKGAYRETPRSGLPRRSSDQGEEPQPSCDGARVAKSQLFRNPRTDTTLPAMALREVRRCLTHVGVLTPRPAAFALLFVYTVVVDHLWRRAEMVFARHSCNERNDPCYSARRTPGHADSKLDELLKVHGDAKNSLMTIDNKES